MVLAPERVPRGGRTGPVHHPLARPTSTATTEPVPSRAASEEEVLALCGAVAEHPGTTLEAIVEGCLRGFSDDEIELHGHDERQADRPTQLERPDRVGLGRPERTEHQLRPSVRGPRDRRTGRSPDHAHLRRQQHEPRSPSAPCGSSPAGTRSCPCRSRRRRSSCPTPPCAPQMAGRPRARSFERLADFSNYRIGDTIAPENRRSRGGWSTDIAQELGVDPADALVDITAADELRTVLWPLPTSRHG